jgi:hypothetical protein
MLQQKVLNKSILTGAEQYLKHLITMLPLANNPLICILISRSSLKSSNKTKPRYWCCLTISTGLPLTEKSGMYNLSLPLGCTHITLDFLAL